jgi:hypothetical protein
VQRQSTKKPAYGASSVYYYVNTAGYLTRRQGTTGKLVPMQQIGTKYTDVAVSPDGRYLAALDASGRLYTGLIGGDLVKRGTGYQAMSWDANDNLWAAGAQVIMFRVTVTVRQPKGQWTTFPVDVNSEQIKNWTVPFSALRVAPDGVRVALIYNDVLTFGAISGQQGLDPKITLSPVALSPLNAIGFSGLTWYGPDNVITLAQPGSAPVATEYPVSGGNPTSIPVEPGMDTITASYGNMLIAGLTDGTLVADNSLTGAWMPLGLGTAPAYPG